MHIDAPKCTSGPYIARVFHESLNCKSGAYLYAPLWCISMCTTLVHIYMHHSGAFLYAPLWCMSICTTLVHVYVHQDMHHSCNSCNTLAIHGPLLQYLHHSSIHAPLFRPCKISCSKNVLWRKVKKVFVGRDYSLIVRLLIFSGTKYSQPCFP